MSTKPIAVPFHGETILTAQHQEQVYVAMKPMVEALGLDWRSQHEKLRRNKRYGDITIPLQTASGVQDMLCIPMRKLNGWLFSINPSKVREDLREKVVAYQEECFEALYAYWHQGVAINPRLPLSPEQKRAIQDLVAARVNTLPEHLRKTGYARLWGKVKDHFRVGSYKEVEASRFDELVRFVHDAEVIRPDHHTTVLMPDLTSCQEWLRNLLHFPLETALPYPYQGATPPRDRLSLSYENTLADERWKDPEWDVLVAVRRQGANVDGAVFSHRLKLHLLETMYRALREMESLSAHSRRSSLPYSGGFAW